MALGGEAEGWGNFSTLHLMDRCTHGHEQRKRKLAPKKKPLPSKLRQHASTVASRQVWVGLQGKVHRHHGGLWMEGCFRPTNTSACSRDRSPYLLCCKTCLPTRRRLALSLRSRANLLNSLVSAHPLRVWKPNPAPVIQPSLRRDPPTVPRPLFPVIPTHTNSPASSERSCAASATNPQGRNPPSSLAGTLQKKRSALRCASAARLIKQCTTKYTSTCRCLSGPS